MSIKGDILHNLGRKFLLWARCGLFNRWNPTSDEIVRYNNTTANIDKTYNRYGRYIKAQKRKDANSDYNQDTDRTDR
jgi:hypothetical protein